MYDYCTRHRNSSSGTQDRRTDADNVKIKFMVSSQWFPLAAAHVFDLEAAAAAKRNQSSLSFSSNGRSCL